MERVIIVSTIVIIAYFYLPYYLGDNHSCRLSIINSRKFLFIETEIKMIDFYREIRSDLMNKTQNFFVLEGPSMQGKSTFGKTFYNELIKNSEILPFYFENPENIFEQLEKCSWNNFRLVIDELRNEHRKSYKQIVFITDNIQLLFKANKTEIFSVFKAMRSSKVQFIFISSANSIIGNLRHKK